MCVFKTRFSFGDLVLSSGGSESPTERRGQEEWWRDEQICCLHMGPCERRREICEGRKSPCRHLHCGSYVLDEKGRLGSPLANYGESFFNFSFFFTSNDPDICLANYTAPIAFYIFSALSPASV